MLNHKAKRITKVSQGKFLIVQCARTIGPGHGVSSPALCLERAFKQLGYECERFTLRNIGIRDATPDAGSRGIRTFRFWWNIIFCLLRPLRQRILLLRWLRPEAEKEWSLVLVLIADITATPPVLIIKIIYLSYYLHLRSPVPDFLVGVALAVEQVCVA